MHVCINISVYTYICVYLCASYSLPNPPIKTRECINFSNDIVCCSVLQCVAVCCSVLQCVAVCCSVLQRVAECIVTNFSNDTCTLITYTYEFQQYPDALLNKAKRERKRGIQQARETEREGEF